jgi:hypothetical protein
VTLRVWQFSYRVEAGLPPLAWVARIDTRARRVEVDCGTSVRREEAGFYDGTWAGERGLESVSRSTTAFGSGIVCDAEGPVVVTPSHTIAGVYTFHSPEGVRAANSLVALLVAARLELEPTADYPGRFVRSIDGISASPVEVPTSGGTVSFDFFWNLRVADDGSLRRVARPTEVPFTSFGNYRDRVSAALGSAIENTPEYEPVVALSSGYDSTAVAVLAAERGCRRALTLTDPRGQMRGRRTGNDSGATTARALALAANEFDRLAYLGRDDFPEAEFLATGMSGEDVVMSAFEPKVKRTLLLTGTQGNGIWRVGGSHRADLRRSALDGASLNEFRLRADFIFVPLPVFGLPQRASVMAISAAPEMRRWSVGGRYDQPISRRIAEEAGIPRGSFAVRKRAASSLIHAGHPHTLSPATLADVTRFAAAEGRTVDFSRRFRAGRRHRMLLKLGAALRAERLTVGLNSRRRRLVHFEPEIGTLLLRWAVGTIRPRYRVLEENAVTVELGQ